MRRWWFLWLVACWPVASGQAQDYPRDQVELDRFVEELFQFQEEDIDYEDLYEALFQYYRQPLNLNLARREDLQSLFVLSELQINSLLAYREAFGDLISIYELQAVPSFDLNTIYRLVPFATVADRADARTFGQRLREADNHYLLLRYERVLEERRGFQPPDTAADGTLGNRYLGSPDQLYARYRLSRPRDFSFGFTLEKDAGEQLVWDPDTHRYGIDFFSVHALLENRGRWRSVAVGDYQLQFGQGLILSSGFAIGKGSETINTTRRSTLGVRPYTSVLEGGFFRGAAATYQLTPRLDLTGFASYQRVDGSQAGAADTLDAPADFVSALPLTGFHRTPTEIANKDRITEGVGGAHLTYRNAARTLTLGATAVATRYSLPLRRADRLFNRLDFNGDRNAVVGVDWSWTWRNLSLFGEGARSRSGGLGATAGLLTSLSREVELALVWRHYDADFHTLYGLAFGERTRNLNERGLYGGIKISPSRRVTLAAYYDRFRFPFLSFRADAPARGDEALVRLTYAPSRRVVLYGQWRVENKERNRSDNETPIDFLVNHRRRNYLLHLSLSAPEVLTLGSRVQFSTYDEEETLTRGYAIIQDLTADLGQVRLSGRFALFDTDDFDNRQYAYEKDVLYAFSIPAYAGRGVRMYLLARWKVARRADLWVRLARTNFRDRDEVGSGLDRIDAPHRTDVTVQWRQQF